MAEQMKREAMAAALGAIDAGADEVYIKDAHDSGRNMDITGFPKPVSYTHLDVYKRQDASSPAVYG